MSEVLVLEARIKAELETVQRALTDPGALRKWFAEYCEVEAGRYEFWGRWTPQGDRPRQRAAVVDENGVGFTWTLDGRDTAVRLDVRPGDDHVVVRLTQDGQPSFEELMAPEGRRDGLHSMHTFWPLALARLAEYAEGRALTPAADFGAARKTEIRARVDIAAPATQVFTALTEPARIAHWFGVTGNVFEPRVGGKVTVGIEGEITDFEPDRWIRIADDEGTVVNWMLAGSDGETRLTFVQSGYTDQELDNAAQHEAGWFAALAELRRVAEQGDNWKPLMSDLSDDS